MATSTSLSTDSKRRRIMIITADTNNIDQIGKIINDTSLLAQIAFSSIGSSSESKNQQKKEQLVVETDKTTCGFLTCVICGSRAKGFNFGIISCESCKAFFRRNALKDPATVRCRRKGQCEIIRGSRRICPSCRLTKCLNSGMQRDRLLTSEQKIEKHRTIEENRNLTLQVKSNTNEQQSQSTSSVLLDDTMMTIDTNALLDEFINFLSPRAPTPVQHFLLSSEDFQRIETISSLYQKRIELAAREGLPWDPSVYNISYLQTLNSCSVPIMRLLSFFKQLPEFNQLNIDDRVTLIKYNIMTVLVINISLVYDIENDQYIEADSDAPWNTQYDQLVHGYNLCKQMEKKFMSLLKIAKCDERIIHLALIIFILTKGFTIIDSDEPPLNDQMSVFHVQSYYTELLWKYMESVHGLKKAIHLLSQFMGIILSWQTIQEQLRNDIVRILSPKDIDELLPIMKSVLRIS